MKINETREMVKWRENLNIIVIKYVFQIKSLQDLGMLICDPN